MSAHREEELVDALRERLASSEDKQYGLYGRLQDARDQVLRLRADRRLLEEVVAESRERNAHLARENGDLRRELWDARTDIAALVDERRRLDATRSRDRRDAGPREPLLQFSRVKQGSGSR